MSKIKCNITYPNDPNYEYRSYLKRVDLDKKREESIVSGNGFLITQIQSSLKKDLKSPNGIYSTKFGRTLEDLHPFQDKYRCECGNLRGIRHANEVCNICGSIVEKVDDNFNFFGWLVLDDLYTIHPNLYKTLVAYIGNKKKDPVFDNIITPVEEKDENGFPIKDYKKPDGQPYYGIGIMGLKENFDEIIEFYKSKRNLKYYDDIIKNKDIMFTHSIPVYTTSLRPFMSDSEKFTFESTNRMYSMMSRIVLQLNDKSFKGMRRNKTKNRLLYDLTIKYQELYIELEKILSGKKGAIRSVFSGRCSFSSRSVIVPEPNLRIDEVIMPYEGMVELLQQSIINILQKTYNITYSIAYNIWENGKRQYDERIMKIIQSMIKSRPRGIEILINRNPTISFGGILQMYVVGVCKSYSLKLPLQILHFLAADFDGDVLNILYLVNRTFIREAVKLFNPRNNMISRNDGKLDYGVIHNKDTMINLNSLLYLSRNNYTEEQINQIIRIKNMT